MVTTGPEDGLEAVLPLVIMAEPEGLEMGYAPPLLVDATGPERVTVVEGAVTVSVTLLDEPEAPRPVSGAEFCETG